MITLPIRNRYAFTLVEAVVALILVSGLLVAALNTVGAAHLSRYRTLRRHQAQLLAETLLAEIGTQTYADPQGAVEFGPEDGENTGTRAAFDDVDDYHNWTASPPAEKDGSVLVAWSDWQRQVTVTWIDPADPTRTLASESRAKQVTVRVSHKGIPVTTLSLIKTDTDM